MKIYTKTGDDGTTGLFGGDRVLKSHALIQSYGTVDETNSVIGLVVTEIQDDTFAQVRSGLSEVQHDLFVVGADLATPHDAKPLVPRVTNEMVKVIEQKIDGVEGRLPDLERFILPGGSRAAALLHVARTTCRRAERLAVEALAETSVNGEAIKYLNRLSDYLFVLARQANQLSGHDELEWHGS